MDKKWNLQDIKPATPIRKRRQQANPKSRAQEIVPESAPEDEAVDLRNKNSATKKRSHLVIAFAIFLIIVGAGVLVSYLMAGAEITVYPKHRTPTINATFEAYRTPQVDELSYEILTLEADGERQVSATGQAEVDEQATGVLTIYNETTNAERLIKNTRFESPDGLIFRTTESVVVPGAVENGKGELVPGQIQAEVFAVEPGEEYNLAAGTRFSIPGFAEGGFSELFENLYAVNESSITGGFSGVQFILDEAELKTATEALHTELREALLARVGTERPAGFVFFPSAVTFTYESQPAVEYGDELATIRKKAILRVPLFAESEFAAYLATASIPSYEGESVRIDDIGVMTFSYTSATTTNANISNFESLSFELVGRPHIVWTFDKNQLKADLVGAPKTAPNTIISGYPGIQKVKAVIRPFWRQSFPADADEITIIEDLSEPAE